MSLHRLLGHLPIGFASAIGGWIVRTNVRWNRPEIIQGARRNLRRHRPDLTQAACDRFVWRFLDSVGRLMAEFALLERISDEGRLSLSGAQALLDRRGEEAVMAIVLHTGNWELFGPALRKAGVRVASFYEPPEGRAARRIAEETRRAVGLELLSPDRSGVTRALSLLRDKQMVAIFGDEARQGRTMAPLFGRPPQKHCNLAIAAKLARRTNACIVIIHSERKWPCRFDMRISEPFHLSGANEGLLSDVAELNAHIEPIVLSLLDQWYYLDDMIDDEPEALNDIGQKPLESAH